MEIRYFDINDKNFKSRNSLKFDFFKLEPGSFIETNFINPSHLRSLRVAFYQWRKKNQPTWKGGVRVFDDKIRIIRWE